MTGKTSPFKFLDSYQQQDADIFFGRERETDALYHALSGVKHLLVHGPSGAGKTSLIECGLRNQFSDADWFALSIRRGQNMTASVFEKINAALREKIAINPDTKLPTDPAIDFGQAIDRLFAERFQPVYLLFDQFEELLLLGSNDVLDKQGTIIEKGEKTIFFERLHQLIRYKVPCRVLLVMREEFIGHLSEWEHLCPSVFQHRFRLEKMGRSNVREVLQNILEAPKYRSNFRVEQPEQLAESILAKLPDTQREIDLTHVQVFLGELWDRAVAADPGAKNAKNSTIRPILHSGLVKSDDNLERVLDSFLKKQLEELAPKHGEKAPLELLAAMISERQTKLQVSAADLQQHLAHNHIALLQPLLDLLRDLEEHRILRAIKSGEVTQYEITHDLLAKVVGDNLTPNIKLRKEADKIYQVYLGQEGLFSEDVVNRLRSFQVYLAYPTGLEEKIVASEQYQQAQKEAEIERQQQELAEAKKRAETERKLADKANAALAEVREKNVSIFQSFLGLGTELIRSLDHDKALEKMEVAVDIEIDTNLKKQQLTEPIAELLFFFAEGGRRPDLARTAAKLLAKLEPAGDLAEVLQKCSRENWDQRSQFAPLLKKLQFFQKFQARYYPDMVSIPLGKDATFEMGSPESESGHQSNELQHQVKLSPYQITTTLITFYQFALFSEANDKNIASRTPFWGRFGDHPVVNVSWYDALEFANWLNVQNGWPRCYNILKEKNSDKNNQVQNDYSKWKIDWDNTAKGFRLPTEAEWELAARGGVGARQTLYAGSDTLEEVGWFWKNSGDKPLTGDWDLNKVFDNNGRTHRVKEKADNGIGLFDMSGNVYEWCWDWYSAAYYNECHEKGLELNPAGAESSTEGRVIRGGSWYDFAEYCRAAYRYRYDPDFRYHSLGFRLVFVP